MGQLWVADNQGELGLRAVDSSYIDEGIPTATTFPQWGYEAKGGNPNLVSEKSFEWHAGPYVAVSVYAFLAGVLGYAVIRFRKK